jgi:hypothetical protein
VIKVRMQSSEGLLLPPSMATTNNGPATMVGGVCRMCHAHSYADKSRTAIDIKRRHWRNKWRCKTEVQQLSTVADRQHAENCSQ